MISYRRFRASALRAHSAKQAMDFAKASSAGSRITSSPAAFRMVTVGSKPSGAVRIRPVVRHPRLPQTSS